MQTPEPTPAPESSHLTQAGSSDSVPQPLNVKTAPFYFLAGLFDNLQKERKPEKRRRLLDSWFTHWRQESGNDFFPVLRLILPHKDRERKVYNLKEKNLAKIYIKLIGLNARDGDAIRLLNWKRPTEAASSGDFPTVLFDVVNKRSSVLEGSLSIDELNEVLDNLASNHNSNDQSRALQRIYDCTTPMEQRWIARIILKDMVISVKETTVFSVFHPDAQDLFNSCSDLKKVAWELWDPSRRLNADDKALQIFRVFAPMLCKRPTKRIEDTVKAMQGQTFIIEEKLDGERIQLHKQGNNYFYSSRKGKDYTDLYGAHPGVGSLTPYIHSAFDPRIDSMILDGELVVFDPVSGRFLPFGHLKSAAKASYQYSKEKARPCFKVFDLLFLNGKSLAQNTTKFRKKNLRHCITEVPGRIEFVQEFEGQNAQDIRDRMDIVMEDRGEGLVIKHPKSQYVLNGRNNDWIKIKPEYMDNMGETVDVLVVGGNYGNGKRGGGVSTLICAVYDDRRPVLDDDEERMYSSFVRIGSGLSYSDYVDIRQKNWKVWDPKHPPAFFQTASKSNEDKGDVYLEPADSFIIKVKAAEIVHSDQYHMGFTMRFPRALYIRDDLTEANCMTASEILESMRSEKKRKMTASDGITTKKRKINTKKAIVLSGFEGPNTKNVEIESSLFKGMTFAVFTDPKAERTRAEKAKAELLTSIHAHGGEWRHSPPKHGECLIVFFGNILSYDIKLLQTKDIYDIAKPQYIRDCIAAETILPLEKKYLFYATTARRSRDDYNPDVDDTVEDETMDSADAKQPDSETEDEAEVEKDEAEIEIDPAMAAWLKPNDNPQVPPPDSDTEPDNDSDNDDNNQEELSDNENDTTNAVVEADPDVKMGDDTAMEYDTELIFKHLCFYLDLPSNARKYGMKIDADDDDQAEIEKSLGSLRQVIEDYGGRATDDLDEPKLTHIVLDSRDDCRRIALNKRTAKPKRRCLVLSEFITRCMEEHTLLNEEDFLP